MWCHMVNGNELKQPSITYIRYTWQHSPIPSTLALTIGGSGPHKHRVPAGTDRLTERYSMLTNKNLNKLPLLTNYTHPNCCLTEKKLVIRNQGVPDSSN